MRLVKANINTSCPTGTNLSRLIAKLKESESDLSLQQRIDLIRQSPIHARDVWRFVVLDSRNYHREIVETNEQFEMLVLTWLPGQKSPIHNHKDSQCIVRLLSGSAVETVYEPNQGGTFSHDSIVYKQGETVGGEDSDIHTIENPKTAAKPLVTLHTYFPPLRKMELFTIENDRLIQTVD